MEINSDMKRRTFLGSALALFIPTSVIGKTIIENNIAPPTEEEDFFQFFLNFNGFPISDNQKSMFRFYKHGYTSSCYGRRMGVSTFMITLAAWEAFKGKRVVHFSSSEMLRDLCSKQYERNIVKHFDGKSPPIDFVNINRKTYPLKGLRYDIALLDQSYPYYHDQWSYIVPMVDKHLLMKTYEL